jgi:hypothetical protein
MLMGHRVNSHYHIGKGALGAAEIARSDYLFS